MKKIITLSFMFAAMLTVNTALAQETSSYGQDVTSLTLESQQDEKTEWQKRQSSFELHYGFPFANKKMHGGSAGITGVIKHVLFGAEAWWYKTNFMAVQVPIGGNYRYFPAKQFYLEGRAMVGYRHSQTDVMGYTDKYNTGYLGISPRIGIMLGKAWGITAGYECDFDFKKFDSPSHRVLVGLAFDIDDL